MRIEFEGAVCDAIEFVKSFSPVVPANPPAPQSKDNPEPRFYTMGTAHDIIDYIYSGQKVNAIKLYRDRYNVGLKESKDAVDAFQEALNKIFP